VTKDTVLIDSFINAIGKVSLKLGEIHIEKREYEEAKRIFQEGIQENTGMLRRLFFFVFPRRNYTS
jgi:hypothetical protein